MESETVMGVLGGVAWAAEAQTARTISAIVARIRPLQGRDVILVLLPADCACRDIRSALM